MHAGSSIVLAWIHADRERSHEGRPLLRGSATVFSSLFFFFFVSLQFLSRHDRDPDKSELLRNAEPISISILGAKLPIRSTGLLEKLRPRPGQKVIEISWTPAIRRRSSSQFYLCSPRVFYVPVIFAKYRPRNIFKSQSYYIVRAEDKSFPEIFISLSLILETLERS